MANKGQENLIPFNQRTEEEQREIARQGGIASGEARREKATMKKTLEMLLNTKNNKGQSYQELATLGLIKGAIKGNAQNYRMILETLGELKVGQEDKEKEQLTKVDELLLKIAEGANDGTNN